MTTSKRRLLRRIATRGVVATLPVAIASAYAGGIFLSPPREVKLDYLPVAEIINSSSTVGVADSSLVTMSQADINKTLDELQSIGVTNIRVLVPWANIETSDNVYNWTQMDMVMSAAAARNMGVMADINSTPLWAAPPNTYPGAGAPPTAQFASFVQQVASKYGSTISAYEMWNEPNYALFYQPIDPVSYTALLAAAYPIIKSLDPTATVVAGALGAGSTTGLTMNPVDFVKAMMTAGAGSYFDALSFHPYQETLKFSAGYTYPGLGTPLEQLDAIKSLIGLTKSVWISEYGLPTSDVSQQQQSDYIKDLLDYWQGYSQAGPVFIYTTKDGTVGGTSVSENSYGLFNTDWTPKLAAEMLKAWIAAHPTAGTPTNPGTPTVDPVTAYFQALAKQINDAIAAFVAAIQSWMAAWAPAPAATPLVAKVASVAALAATEQTAATTSNTVAVATADGGQTAQSAAKTAVEAEASVAAAVETVAESVAVSTPVNPAAVATPTAVEATPLDATTPVEVPAEASGATDIAAPVTTKPPVAGTPVSASSAGTSATAPSSPNAETAGSVKDSSADSGKGASPGANASTGMSNADKSTPSKPGANQSSKDKSSPVKSSSQDSPAEKSDTARHVRDGKSTGKRVKGLGGPDASTHSSTGESATAGTSKSSGSVAVK